MTVPVTAPGSGENRGRLDDDEWMDQAVAPFRLLVDSLAVTAEPLVATGIPGLDASPEGMFVASMDITLPVELDLLVEPTGRVRLAGTAPTQYTRTTVLPVFHRLGIRVSAAKRDG
jgi:hypothetical protein